MAGANTKAFTEANFQAEVLEAAEPVLVDFWAEWCGPCRYLAPTIDKLADAYVGKVKVGKVDTEEARDVALKYRIEAIPTVLIFKGGQIVRKFVGLRQENDFREALDEVLKPAAS